MWANQQVLREINPGNMSNKLFATSFFFNNKTMCGSENNEKNSILLN
jgi:hypothetical protein